MRSTRRRVLQVTIAAGGSLLLPFGAALPQTRSPALLRAPKIALLIGNSAYKSVPLRNPGNDAKDMAGALKAIGFDVTLGLDLGQGAMSETIQSYTDRLAKTGAVGVFFFAGHGTQLAWRNYVVPTDVEIASVELIRERCIDINTLIAGIRKAGNPMNVIILDACRDNPFGSTVQLDQKGLSQLDAPPGTFLAYATAPGNTAIDGDGANGLYTGHLLREIKVPEAKIEDVFKRVRLAVRRASNGQQIPWESTSLEEDFWFIPPKELRRLAESEIQREFQVEAALWERIKTASEPEPLEEYLRRHPNGRYSELAQAQLDRVLAKMGEKKVEVVSAQENPYSKGTARTNVGYVVGDRYIYRDYDLYTKLETRTRTMVVTSVTDNEVIFNKTVVLDLLGNTITTTREQILSTSRQFYVPDYSVGKRWQTTFEGTGIDGERLTYDYKFRVEAKEKKTVPAGTFDAYKVVGLGYSRTSEEGKGGSQLNNVYWIAPDLVRRPIAIERLNVTRFGRRYLTEGEELVSYSERR